jgi:ABC-type phosphate/phosphonate transport system substrate-binding protein
MSPTIWVGAVAYDPKVVTIWEGMRRYFHEEARLPVEVVLFQSYEMQVAALLAKPTEPLPRIDIAWNTNLAYLLADSWSDQRCRPIAMRDTDLGWKTIIVTASGGPVSKLSDLRGRTLSLGSRDSGHAAILPVYFWSAKAWPRAGTIRRCASTAMSANTATRAPVRWRLFAQCSTAAPMPVRSAAPFGRRYEPNDWYLKVH